MSQSDQSDRYSHLLKLWDEARGLDPPACSSFLEELATSDVELAKELTLLLQKDTRQEEDSTLAALKTLPLSKDLEMLSTLAEGGMGRVMLAQQLSLERPVAVKVLKQGLASPQLVSGLLQEAVICGSLEHPNIVPVHLLALDDTGQPLLVMKRVEGVSWQELISNPEHPTWRQIVGGISDRLSAHLSILMSVCNALNFAHSRGVLHCDIKPRNVMVGSFGEVYLVDWGIAQRLRNGVAVVPAGRIEGTIGFVAPEMASDAERRLDPRTDVFLLGATLHYVLTLRHRHEGKTVYAQLVRAAHPVPVTYGPEVPEELAAICNRATAADPAQRYESPAALSQALSDFLRHRGSIELSDTATAKLALLKKVLSMGQTEEVRSLHELMTECQFGFQESLRAWPSNLRAQAGLQDCLQLIIRYEVSQENLARAEALLSFLSEPPEDLVAAVNTLRQTVALRSAREAQFREMERQRNWGTGATVRAAFLMAAFAVGLLVFRVARHYEQGLAGPISAAALTLFFGLAVALIGILAFVLRSWLFPTQVTRRFILGVFCCIFGMLISRSLHMIPATQVAAILSIDQVIGATAAAIGAVALVPWLWLVVPIFLGGAVTARLWCEFAPAIMGVSLGLSTLICLWFLSRKHSPLSPANEL